MKFSTATLAYFREICREKGFSQAAGKLEKSQSAVSTQIAVLEKDLGIKLFDRSKRPLLLTEAGQLFLDFARDVLNKTEDFERSVSELSSGRSRQRRDRRQHFGGHIYSAGYDKDEYRLRVLAMIDEKVKGHEITAAPQPAAKPGPVIDLMEASRQSMKKVPDKKAAKAPRKTQRRP
jgi:hypothetical protein